MIKELFIYLHHPSFYRPAEAAAGAKESVHCAMEKNLEEWLDAEEINKKGVSKATADIWNIEV